MSTNVIADCVTIWLSLFMNPWTRITGDDHGLPAIIMLRLAI